jgi:hypothetical protein
VHHREIAQGKLLFEVVIALYAVNMLGRERSVHEDAA